MKNLFIFLSLDHRYDEETELLAKIQIENSLELGWKKDDIVPVTNFDYEYLGVKALKVDTKFLYLSCLKSTKTSVVLGLFDMGFIKEGEVYWSHDPDVYQLEPIDQYELGLEQADMALTDYGRMPRWNMGSVFFKHGAADIFVRVKTVMEMLTTNEEKAIEYLVKIDPSVRGRMNKLDISYNLHSANIRRNYRDAIKPIRAVHFHPMKPVNPRMQQDQVGFFLRGENKINTQIVPDRVVRIFGRHGIL